MNIVGESDTGPSTAPMPQVARNPHRVDPAVEGAFQENLQISSATLRGVGAVEDIAAFGIGIENGRQACIGERSNKLLRCQSPTPLRSDAGSSVGVKMRPRLFRKPERPRPERTPFLQHSNLLLSQIYREIDRWFLDLERRFARVSSRRARLFDLPTRQTTGRRPCANGANTRSAFIRSAWAFCQARSPLARFFAILRA